MKGKFRITCIALLVALVLSLFTVSVYADEDDDVVATDPAPVVTEAPKPEPVATEAPKKSTPAVINKPTQAQKSRSVVNNNSRSSNNYNSNNNYNNNNNYNSNSNNNYNNNNNNNNYNNNQSRSAIVSSTKAATSPVYDVDKEKVATDTLKKNDWASIKEKLSRSENSDDANDADSFSYIQDNNFDGDNGLWILYSGIGLEVLAGIIIITLIILGVKRRKRLQRKCAEAGIDTNSQRHFEPKRSHTAPPPTRTQKRQTNKRSKYDTDEINLRAANRRSNGKRYKPKH